MASGIEIIFPQDYASNPICDQANSNYPASNVSDDHPKNVCLSTLDWMDMIVTVAAGATGLAATGIAGSAVTATIESPNSVELKTGEGAVTLKTGEGAVTLCTATVLPLEELFEVNEFGVGTLWIEFADSTFKKYVKLAITGATDYAAIGVIKAGLIDSYRQALPSIKENSKDLSSVRRLNSGALHITDRDVIRTFGFSFFAERDTDFWDFMLTFHRQIRSNACFWRLHIGSTKMEWVVFARFAQPPQGTTVAPTWTQISCSLEEVL